MGLTLSNWRHWVPLLAGPLLFIAIQLVMPESLIDPAPRTVLALTVWMGAWWVTEPVPIPVTSFLPMLVLPLSGVMVLDDAVVGYANPVIYMYMGGFILAIAIERWNLHRRIALAIVNRIGNSLRSIVLGVLIASAFLSMWISNAATALMMLPIAVALTNELDERDQFDRDQRDSFARILLLTVAYSASIGGLATIIGSVPNAIVVAMIPQFFEGVEISFLQWMIFALPLTLILLVILYVYLTRLYTKVPNTPLEIDFVAQELASLGPMSKEEKRVLGVFVVTALAWALRGWLAPFFDLPINDTLIAVTAAIALFVIPAHNEKRALLVWDDMKSLGAVHSVGRRHDPGGCLYRQRFDRLDQRPASTAGWRQLLLATADHGAADAVFDRDHLQYGHGQHGIAHYRRHGGGDYHRQPAGADGRRRASYHLRLHATDLDPAQCGRVLDRAYFDQADGQGRLHLSSAPSRLPCSSTS